MAGNALYDVGLRLRAAELYDMGRGRASIAALLGIPEETVRKWLDIYRSAGIEVLAMMGKKHAAYSFETQLAAVVVRMLAENEVSSMPVIDERNQVVGFISDGDVMGAIAQHRAHTIFTGGDASMLYFDDQSLEQRIEDLKDRCVMDFATRQVVCARPEQSIARVAALLAKKKFKKLPVVDDEGKLVGVIRRSAITKYIFGILFQ